MTTLDCGEESVGGSVGSVGKAVGDPFVTHWESVGKALEKCWNLPIEWKSASVRFPVRGHLFSVSLGVALVMTSPLSW